MNLKWIGVVVLFGATASGQMEMNMDAMGSGTKFMQEMNASMKQMDHEMASAPMTGNVDHDFAAMMIPHHQGAIDMAKGELSYGKDPVMRRLAEEIIIDQQSEIEVMRLWLKKNAATKKELSE
jgi:uncharacterized protein (DUF305 family)